MFVISDCWCGTKKIEFSLTAVGIEFTKWRREIYSCINSAGQRTPCVNRIRSVLSTSFQPLLKVIWHLTCVFRSINCLSAVLRATGLKPKYHIIGCLALSWVLYAVNVNRILWMFAWVSFTGDSLYWKVVRSVLRFPMYMGSKDVLRLVGNQLRADFVAQGVLEHHKLLKRWKILVQKWVLAFHSELFQFKHRPLVI